MANEDMNSLVIGNKYTGSFLSDLLGYKSAKGIGKGIVTPAGRSIIILLVTKRKTASSVPYEDSIEGDVLYLAGQEKHGTDKRLLQNLKQKKDDFHLFVRDKHGEPYTYMGQCFLIDAVIKETSPSQFTFLIQTPSSGFDDEDALVDYLVNKGDLGPFADTLPEGARIVAQHIRYERNPANRRAAIMAQGTVCRICGFDYNKAYGADLAADYIEVHHIKPLYEGEQQVDPKTDLIPICANCHRMLHRRRKDNVSIEELRNRVAHK